MWQPIETAPKASGRILVIDKYDNDSCGVAYWYRGDEYEDEGWYSAFCVDGVTMFHPTHWMPLPQPPIN